jgi:hypothetical protein
LLRAIVDADACPLEDVFVVGALIDILEASPPADVVDEQSRKLACLVFYVRHQSIETLSTSDI